MKTILSISIFFLAQSLLIAQIPQKMSYQAVVRNQANELVSSQSVGLEISILHGSDEGTVVYTEAHEAITNANGLISIVIGDGIISQGQISTINWANGPFFIKSSVDPDGGTDYTIVGASELLSVPYALFALSGDSDWVEDVPGNIVYTNRNIALESDGEFPFRVNEDASTGVPRVQVNAIAGIAIEANSNTGVGILGQSAEFTGVHGISDNLGQGVYGESDGGEGVLGESNNLVGVKGRSVELYGVSGITEGTNVAGVFGNGQEESYGVFGETQGIGYAGVLGIGGEGSAGVFGESTDIFTAGVHGDGLDKTTGVFGTTNAEDAAGVLGDGGLKSSGVVGYSVDRVAIFGKGENKQGVHGKSDNEVGVEGESKTTWGIEGTTEFIMDQENLDPKDIGTGTIFRAGGYGHALKSYGLYGFSDDISGSFSLSNKSNGVVGATLASSEERAGVYGAAKFAHGLYGWSENQSGVRARSKFGKAGEFEGELHIETGFKQAKLLIEEMEDDNNAPCLVWSGDKYVRKRECWTLEEVEGNKFFKSSNGVKISNGEDVTFLANTDGSTMQYGLGTFLNGLVSPIGGDGLIRILPNDGISIVIDTSGQDYLFHADPNGNAYAANSFYSPNISADFISAFEKNFRIDHPLDPENKYLYHTSIESSERLNIYSGNSTTDQAGFVKVYLPDWFSALNTDFRYQLTAIGSFTDIIVSEEFNGKYFVIQTKDPISKVSWQITGVRHDTYARENPTKLEMNKREVKGSPYGN